MGGKVRLYFLIFSKLSLRFMWPRISGSSHLGMIMYSRRYSRLILDIFFLRSGHKSRNFFSSPTCPPPLGLTPVSPLLLAPCLWAGWRPPLTCRHFCPPGKGHELQGGGWGQFFTMIPAPWCLSGAFSTLQRVFTPCLFNEQEIKSSYLHIQTSF